MNVLLRTAFLGTALLALAACNKGDDAAKTQAAAEPVVLTAPVNGTDQDWKLYLQGVVKQNMQGVRSSPYMYYLPAATAADFEDQYNRQLDNVATTVARTVTPGNMLAFGSPEYTRMADLVVAAFKEASPGSFKGVKVLFIGKADDEARIREALTASEAEFIFVEAK